METERKRIFVNTRSSRLVKFLRILSWILAIAGVVIGAVLYQSAEEEAAVPTIVAGVAFLLIAIFLKPAYIRTLAAEITIAEAKENYILCSDEGLSKEIKA